MASRRNWHLSLVSAIAGAALLAACGGGSDVPTTTRVVSFGDSLSDLGTYTIVTSQVPGVAPFFGGRFTTNTHTSYTPTTNPLSNVSTIWVEWIAARVGVPITQAMLGFATTRVPCPIATAIPALAQSCTAYGQGASRVTISPSSTAGPLADPVVTQVAAHLARFTSFSGGDIVFVWAGGNDALAQFGTYAAGGQTEAAAVANMQLAGTQLATLVRDQIIARGATRVMVLTVPDLSVSPGFSANSPAVKTVLTRLTAEFNTSLATGLNGSIAQIFDARAFLNAAIASPATYGFTNVTSTACDPARMAPASGGSSLFCNASPAVNPNSIRAGASASTWLFADGIHPTTGGHRVLSDQIITQLKALGWMAANQ